MSQRINFDRLTAQQAYYQELHWAEAAATRNPARAAALRADGPPPPQPADGYTGQLAYLKHRAVCAAAENRTGGQTDERH
ncbi:hypothetical protein ACQP2U_43015 (plasmid) [Nocardia sp. CA-084685]|uniref:hypothetical protein n=1 Tax=Nocardia sp. CA-084685 TaxID=3239970 RepID=UPI003D9621FF